MVNLCALCESTHDAMNWKTIDIGDNKIHWMCGKWYKPSHPEYVPESTREERREYAKSLLQPWRKGEPSREFIEAYPDKAKHMFTEKERRKAKNVWRDDPVFRHVEKAK